jgi:hypothetical protein
MSAFLILSGIVCAASAETITLTGSGCDANRNCYPDVANDAGLPISLYASTTASSFYLYLDGTMYVGQGSGSGDINQVAVADGGAQVQLQVTFVHWTTKVTSGRGAGRVTQHWAITGGSLVRP